MSKKTITFRYQDKIKQVKVGNLNECRKAFQRAFSLSDEKMKKLSLFYYDEDADPTMLNTNEDFNLFLDIDIDEIEAKDNSLDDKPDPMRSSTILKKQDEEPIKYPISKNEYNSFSNKNFNNINDYAPFSINNDYKTMLKLYFNYIKFRAQSINKNNGNSYLLINSEFFKKYKDYYEYPMLENLLSKNTIAQQTAKNIKIIMIIRL